MNDSKTINVNVRSNFGVDVVYPVCGLAKMLCELANTRTMPDRMLSILKRNGYTINQVFTPKEF